MPELAHQAQPAAFPAGTEPPAATLLHVLESAQRLIAYCDNAAVGGTEDGELSELGLPAMKLRHALSDLRRSVWEMNRSLSTPDGSALLARLAAVRPDRRVA